MPKGNADAYKRKKQAKFEKLQAAKGGTVIRKKNPKAGVNATKKRMENARKKIR